MFTQRAGARHIAVGIIANPVPARDIRRVISNATALQITERANIVLRVLPCLKTCGVPRVYLMPENGGIRHHVRRGIDRAESQGLNHRSMPAKKKFRPEIRYGAIALDGERELSFSNDDDVTIELVPDAFRTVNVSACMQYAAKHGLMRVKTHKTN